MCLIIIKFNTKFYTSSGTGMEWKKTFNLSYSDYKLDQKPNSERNQ